MLKALLLAVSTLVMFSGLMRPASAGVISFTTNTATTLEGSFLAEGDSPANSTTFSPGSPIFTFYPGTANRINLDRYLGDGGYQSKFGFSAGSGCCAEYFILAGAAYGTADSDSESGSYVAFGTTTTVYYNFEGHDTGGTTDGRWSGTFCISTERADCAAAEVPEPATLALLGLGLLGLALTRRELS